MPIIVQDILPGGELVVRARDGDKIFYGFLVPAASWRGPTRPPRLVCSCACSVSRACVLCSKMKPALAVIVDALGVVCVVVAKRGEVITRGVVPVIRAAS